MAINGTNRPLDDRLLGPILRRRAETEGERIYMRCGERSYSFADTDGIVRALARGMKTRGINRHGHVALFLPNSEGYVFAWYATCILGAAMVPINYNYKGFLLDAPLRETGARGLIVHRDLLANLATADFEVRRQLDWVAVVGGIVGADLPEGPANYLDYEELAIDEGQDPEVECDFRDIHSVMFTSGTTGPAKGVLISNAHFFASARVFIRALDFNRDDVLFTNLPLFHGLASRLGALPAMMVGAELVIGDRFSAARFWKDVCDSKATVAHTIFPITAILMGLDAGPHDRAHRLRAMYNAHHDLEFEERFGLRLVEAYGLTETGLAVFTDYPERRLGAAGRIGDDWEIQVVDEMDIPVPVGEPGEMLLRPKRPYIMMQGYMNKPEATLEAWRNLWFHTGDIGRIDEDGFVFFLDRKSGRLRRRGENISSWEVEQGVSAHPAIQECAAVPYPAPGGDDDIRVVCVLKAGETLEASDLWDWLRDRMPRFMVPRYLEFIDEMPHSATNKVEKYKLVEAGLGPRTWDSEAKT